MSDPSPNPFSPELGVVRLNRFLSEAGVASRRDADELIFAGAVTVNGRVVLDPAERLDPERDAVKVRGKRVLREPTTYVLLNKPERVVSTLDDPAKRTTVVDLLRGVKARIYPVGRLDYNTSGLLLLTNDGELALKLTHPRYGFPKTYLAKVEGIPSPKSLLKLSTGVHIPAWSGRYERTQPAGVHLLKRMRREALLEIVLREGRQHQVRKMCEAVGHPVVQLTRIKFGFLSGHGLGPGQWRYLTSEEVEKLKAFKPETLTLRPGAQPGPARPGGSDRSGAGRKPGPGFRAQGSRSSRPQASHPGRPDPSGGRPSQPTWPGAGPRPQSRPGQPVRPGEGPRLQGRFGLPARPGTGFRPQDRPGQPERKGSQGRPGQPARPGARPYSQGRPEFRSTRPGGPARPGSKPAWSKKNRRPR